MNIFVTHHNPKVAAKHLCDKHVPKMLLESAQMLSNAVHLYGTPSNAPYKPMYLQHPCSKWVLESKKNFMWLFEHAREIERQFVKRFAKPHKCSSALDMIESQIPSLKFPKLGRTQFVQCMPKIYRQENVIEAYRSYVKAGKLFAAWKKGVSKPSWMESHAVKYNVHEMAEYIRTDVPIPTNVPQITVDLSASIASAIWSIPQLKANLT